MGLLSSAVSTSVIMDVGLLRARITKTDPTGRSNPDCFLRSSGFSSRDAIAPVPKMSISAFAQQTGWHEACSSSKRFHNGHYAHLFNYATSSCRRFGHKRGEQIVKMIEQRSRPAGHG
jgi:hypothetical protein